MPDTDPVLLIADLYVSLTEPDRRRLRGVMADRGLGPVIQFESDFVMFSGDRVVFCPRCRGTGHVELHKAKR